MKKVIIFFILTLFSFCLVLFSKIYLRKNGLFRFHDWNNVERLMIVAHPDDETLWGSEELLKNKYLVVCITCGTNKKREKEIEAALKISKDRLIVLDKPDKVRGKRSDWKHYKKQIEYELKYVIKKKKWNTIVTHNPEGEYGHIHHKITSNIVTKVYNKEKIGKLKYFGKYYSKKRINQNKFAREIPEDIYDMKIEMIDSYKSQAFIKNRFNQMYKYENLINAEDWK
ncbi:MAG: PIG-L family deacetylase [Mollicutes bacterium]|nr:PIG-L family deacetylase [Mollicutes bacterium]